MGLEPATHVVDANVVVGWSFALPWSSKATTFRTPLNWLIAPDLVVHEVGNAIWKNVRSGVIGLVEGQKAYMAVEQVVDLIPSVDFRFEALDMASKLDHPIYDCFYLALAFQRQIPIITADRKMAAHAASIGVQVEFLN